MWLFKLSRLTVSNGVLQVAENNPLVPIDITAPSDTVYSSTQLTVTVTGLPTYGTVFLSDGVTPVTSGETLTVAQLTNLKFQAQPGVFNKSSTFSYVVRDPSGWSTARGAQTIKIGADTTPPTTFDGTLTVTENAAATAINIPAPTDPNYAASQLTVKVRSLPTDGTVLLSNGTTPVRVGEMLTFTQLAGLEFKPKPGVSGKTYTFTYTVLDPSRLSASGSETLAIGADTSPPVTVDPTLTVAENAAATAINIPAPTDPNYAASQLTVTVTSLPTDGTVLLSNGTTPVTVGQSLTVTQLTGLEFKPTNGISSASSEFAYSVADPAGLISRGTASLIVGQSQIQSPAPGEQIGTAGNDTFVISPITPAASQYVNGEGGNDTAVFTWGEAGWFTISNDPNGGIDVYDGHATGDVVHLVGINTLQFADGENYNVSTGQFYFPTSQSTPTSSGSSAPVAPQNSTVMDYAPTVPQPSQSGDIVGLILQNTQNTALVSREITFGEVFGAGLVPAGAQLEAIINGVATPVQMDVKTTNADGSAASVVLTMEQPTLTANSSTDVMLALVPAGTTPAE